MSNTIQLMNVRLSFPSIFKPRSFEEGGNPRYEATFLYNPDESSVKIDGIVHKGQSGLKAIQKSLMTEATNRWGAGKVPKALKLCLTNGDEKDYEGYAGKYAISSANSTRPSCVDRKRKQVIESDNIIYAGCYVNAVVSWWVQDNQYGKRVNCNLLGIQFYRDGDTFGSPHFDAENEFEDIDDDTDDGFFG